MWSAPTISSEPAVAAPRDQALDHFGRIDVLVTNASPGQLGSFEDPTHQQWREVLSVDLDATSLVCRALLPGTKTNGWDRVIDMATDTVQLVLPWGGRPASPPRRSHPV